MPRHNSKDAILDAVEQIVAERGAAHLTLDAVAQKCGISKGGLMYNFPTKETLIQGMLDRFLFRLDQLRSDARARMGESESSELLVEVMAILAQPPEGIRVHAGLLAVIANDPSLLLFLREDARRRYRSFTAAESDPDDAGLLFFAAFGLHFHDVLDLSLITPKERARLEEKLLGLARGGASLPPMHRKATGKCPQTNKTKGRKE